ncbi:hypothetical protein ASPCADRAFT_210750 [Aspergillus carbonarius ITEM 5010]|uniref:Uncharacterized protein n=1 Tax=Aspergillus carbonarius (strain ITEM 5010) TaxID=602072 RepID=A0A1R3RB94_ASPC5|nr:hypothetical protein ASPCADRAFT_210750 [Aspergillus carbonarius ITEM 5010]
MLLQVNFTSPYPLQVFKKDVNLHSSMTRNILALNRPVTPASTSPNTSYAKRSHVSLCAQRKRYWTKAGTCIESVEGYVNN